MRSGIWFVATTRVSVWEWKWFKRHCLLISMLEKLNLFHLNGQINLVLLIWKWMSLLLRKNRLLICWDYLSLLNWIGGLTLSQLLKLSPRKLEPWFVLWSFFPLRLLSIFINLPYGLAWNIAVMSRLVLLPAIWICYISYSYRHVGLLVQHLLPFLNSRVIVEM